MMSYASPVANTADFGSRFSAFMIDAALLFSAQWLVVIVLARQLQSVGFTTQRVCDPAFAGTPEETLCEGPSTALWVVLLLLLILSTVAYHAVFEGLYGATPGKRWMGLRVVAFADAAPQDQAPIGLLAGTLRALVRQAFWLSLFFIFDASPLGLSLPPVLFLGLPALTLVVFVVAALRSDGRGVHDQVAGTQVVRRDRSATPMVDILNDPDQHQQNAPENLEEPV